MVQAILELQDAGVEPDVWKIEGLERREDCEKIVAAASAVVMTMWAASSWAAVKTTRRFRNG
jgi:myo-inositol catabolism protein IolC